jgi:hypothetical protein
VPDACGLQVLDKLLLLCISSRQLLAGLLEHVPLHA